MTETKNKKTRNKKQNKTRNKNTNCPFCSSKRTTIKESLTSQINNKKYTLNECLTCKLQFFTPLKFENVYENEKDTSYIPFHKGRNVLPSWTVKIGKVLKKYYNNKDKNADKNKDNNLKNKTILDVGAGDAINYKMLSEQFGVGPQKYYALELDKKSLASARKRGVTNIIHQYFDKKMLNTKQRFDLIIASEVLEHQVDPKEFIDTCFALLKKDGLLIITVPNRKRLFLKHRSVPEDCPPHHFLRFNKTFFKKNFKNNLVLVDHYHYGLRDFKDSCTVFSGRILKSKHSWPVFAPVVVSLRMLDTFKGVGIIAIIKK